MHVQFVTFLHVEIIFAEELVLALLQWQEVTLIRLERETSLLLQKFCLCHNRDLANLASGPEGEALRSHKVRLEPECLMIC